MTKTPNRFRFRGVAKDTGELVYGQLVVSRERPGRTAYFIIECDGECNEPHNFILCEEGSIGQSTGLADKNGKEIFESDILSLGENPDDPMLVYFSDISIRVRMKNKYENEFEDFFFIDLQDIEVIGNIYENPELLKKD